MKRLENIFLIRHARSLRNERLGRDIPDCNVPLSDEGKKQAVLLGNAAKAKLTGLNIPEHSVRIWTSPYARTRETRDGMLPKISEFVLDSREDMLLTEWNYGLFDGLTEAERFEKYPDEAKHFAENIAKHGKFYARPLNGESWQDVCVRVRQFFGTIVRDSEKSDPVQNVAIVSHGLAICAFIMMWMHHEVEWLEKEPNPQNASIRHIGRDDKGKCTRYHFFIVLLLAFFWLIVVILT